MPDDATDLLPTRRSLLSRLKRCDDQSAWQTFFDTYWRLLYSVARKAGLTDAEAQDAVQETVIKVSKHIGQFRYEPAKCSFKTWLMLLTRQRIATQFQKRQKVGVHASACPAAGARQNRLKPGLQADDTDTATLERIPDPAGVDLEAVWDEEWQNHLLATATQRVKQRVKPEHYQMFHLYALEHWPPGEVARVLRVSVAQVYLAKHRVGRLLRQEIQKLETEEP
jgi:RNA polymerase sigma-70 factor (ECF subfamily)